MNKKLWMRDKKSLTLAYVLMLAPDEINLKAISVWFSLHAINKGVDPSCKIITKTWLLTALRKCINFAFSLCKK